MKSLQILVAMLLAFAYVAALSDEIVPDSDSRNCNGRWPRGSYGLPKPKSGCPYNWNSGYRYHDTEDRNSANSWSSGIHLFGNLQKNNLYHHFCMKPACSRGQSRWHAGKYCIYKKGPCPAGFSSGFVFWDDEDSNNKNKAWGTLPDGVYNRNTKVYYCCRDDGSAGHPITLPTGRPFYLLRYGGKCQAVRGMSVIDEFLHWDDEDNNNKSHASGNHRPDGTYSRNTRIRYCYYY